MEPVTIVASGEVIAKGRPRLSRFGHAYTPARTRNYEEHLRGLAVAAMVGRERFEDIPLRVAMVVDVSVPESWPEKKKQSAVYGGILPTKRPDIDNYQKLVLDAMNGIIFRDDSQVVEIYSMKRYAAEPRLVVRVEPAYGFRDEEIDSASLLE
jgi:Holliday junction resolvase RusA-like endonuclease